MFQAEVIILSNQYTQYLSKKKNRKSYKSEHKNRIKDHNHHLLTFFWPIQNERNLESLWKHGMFKIIKYLLSLTEGKSLFQGQASPTIITHYFRWFFPKLLFFDQVLLDPTPSKAYIPSNCDSSLSTTRVMDKRSNSSILVHYR